MHCCRGLVSRMDTSTNTQPQRSATSWTEEQIEDFLRGANVINKITEFGLRKAATDAFLSEGYILATVTNDIEPFETIHKFSMYRIGGQQHANRRELKKMVQLVMAEIGCKLKADECMIQTSGRRLVVSVFLPRWAWRRPPHA